MSETTGAGARYATVATMAESAHRFSAVMFTDIKGSTAYYSESGDVAGRRKVQHHDEVTYPIVAQHGGEVLDHTGDGLLAVFDEPADACRAGVQMMEEVDRQNAGLPPSDELHIRVALHAGVGIREHDRMFGSIVNTCSRIESVAEGDQIMLSESVYAHLDDDLRSRCFFVEERELRGTGRVLRLYELAWRPDTPRRDGGGPPRHGWPPTPVPTSTCCGSGRSARRSPPSAPTSRRAALWVTRHARPSPRPCVGSRRSCRPASASSVARYGWRSPTRSTPCSGKRHWPAVRPSRSNGSWTPSHGPISATRSSHPVSGVSLHTGEPDDAEERIVERAARLGSAGHGGQILLTADAWREVRGRLAPDIGVRAHGNRALQDSRYSETIFELVVPDLPATDPVLRTPAVEATAPRIVVDAAEHRRPPEEAASEALAAVRVDGPAARIKPTRPVSWRASDQPTSSSTCSAG